jgi:hypothetical protein
LASLFVGSQSRVLGAFSFSVLSRERRLPLIFLPFLFLTVESDRSRILSSNRRLAGHRDHRLLAGLLVLVTLGLLECGVRLVEALDSISVSPSDTRQLYGVLRFIQLKRILLVWENRRKSPSSTLHGIRAARQEFVARIDGFDHTPRIRTDDIFENHNVVW